MWYFWSQLYLQAICLKWIQSESFLRLGSSRVPSLLLLEYAFITSVIGWIWEYSLPHCIITIFLYRPLIIAIYILQVVPSEAHYFLLQDEVSQLERNSDFVMCPLNSLWALRIEFGDVGMEIFFECMFKATVIFLLAEPSWEFGSPVTLFWNIHFRTGLIHFIYVHVISI